MSRFLKICAVAGTVCLVIGLLVTGVSFAYGGSLWGMNFSIGNHSFEPTAFISYPEEHSSYSDIKGLEIECSLGEVRVETSEDSDQIQISGVGFDFREEEGTLKVVSKKSVLSEVMKHARFKDEIQLEAVITIPKDYRFREVEIDMDAGAAYVDGILADRLDLTVDMGEVQVEQTDVAELDLDCGMGMIAYEGSVSGGIEGECGMGSVVLDLAGEKEEFRYQLECGVGDISVDGESYSGLAVKKTEHDSQAAKTMDLECGMGTIEIRFQK